MICTLWIGITLCQHLQQWMSFFRWLRLIHSFVLFHARSNCYEYLISFVYINYDRIAGMKLFSLQTINIFTAYILFFFFCFNSCVVSLPYRIVKQDVFSELHTQFVQKAFRSYPNTLHWQRSHYNATTKIHTHIQA